MGSEGVAPYPPEYLAKTPDAGLAPPDSFGLSNR